MINLPIGQIFLSQNIITEKQLEEALEFQKRNSGTRIANILLELGYITENQYLEVLSQRLNVTCFNSVYKDVEPSALALISKEQAEEMQLLPVMLKGYKLYVLMHDPLDFYAIEDVSILTGYDIIPVLATKQIVMQSIESNYGKLSDDDNCSAKSQTNLEETITKQNALKLFGVSEVAGNIIGCLNDIGFSKIQSTFNEEKKEIEIKIKL